LSPPFDGGLRGLMMSDAGSPPSRLDAAKRLAEEYAALSDEEVITAVLAEHKPSANPVVRSIWIVVGSLFVGFAAIGIFLPGWPTTSWLVAAAYCYGRSSQRLFRWLLTNPLFGEPLLGYYRSGRSLPLHSKIVVCGFIAFFSTFSIWYITLLGDPGFGQTTVAIIAVIGIWWVGWRVPTTQ